MADPLADPSSLERRRNSTARSLGYVFLVIGTLYSGFVGLTGITGLPGTYTVADQELIKFIGRSLFPLLLSALLFAYGFHNRIDGMADAINKASHDSRDVVTALAGVEAWVKLRPFQGDFHHYHLTKNEEGTPIWIYKILRFHGDQIAGRLIADAVVCQNSSDDADEHVYHFEASVSGSHLILRAQRLENPSDVGLEIYPNVGGPPRTLHSGRVNIAWDNKLITAIGILSAKPLKCVTEGAKAGMPVDDASAARLTAEWKKNSEIAQLPRPGDQRLSIQHEWDEEYLSDMLEKSSPDAEIRILTSFFTRHVDFFDQLNRLLLGSQRKVEILIMDPKSPVLVPRYGTPEQRIRENMTAATAAHEITTQLAMLKEVQQQLASASSVVDGNGKAPQVGTLDCRTYTLAPTLISYQIEDNMLVGLLLTHRSANAGPMIQIKRGDPLWTVFEDNWNTVRRFSAEPTQDAGVTKQGADAAKYDGAPTFQGP